MAHNLGEAGNYQAQEGTLIGTRIFTPKLLTYSKPMRSQVQNILSSDVDNRDHRKDQYSLNEPFCVKIKAPQLRYQMIDQYDQKQRDPNLDSEPSVSLKDNQKYHPEKTPQKLRSAAQERFPQPATNYDSDTKAQYTPSHKKPSAIKLISSPTETPNAYILRRELPPSSTLATPSKVSRNLGHTFRQQPSATSKSPSKGSGPTHTPNIPKLRLQTTTGPSSPLNSNRILSARHDRLPDNRAERVLVQKMIEVQRVREIKEKTRSDIKMREMEKEAQNRRSRLEVGYY